MDDLDRVVQRLMQNIKSRSPEQASLPFTVAELYEQLIPYRHNRRELGIESNQDYEVAVMRLLAGERGYIIGDEAMQDALRKEIASSNPDTGAFREFGATQISIAPEALEGRLVQDGASPPATARPARPADLGKVGDINLPQGCRYCSGTLPEERTVTFCPHCGQNLALHQCSACGTEMEQGWKFCIGCGRPNS